MPRADLRTYFHSVVSNLLERGVIRQRAGQSLDDILSEESARVMQEVKEDFFAVGAELGLGLMSSVGIMLGNVVQQGTSQAAQWIGQVVSDAIKGKKR